MIVIKITVVTEVIIMTSFRKKHLNTLTTDHSQGSYSQLLRCFNFVAHYHPSLPRAGSVKSIAVFIMYIWQDPFVSSIPYNWLHVCILLCMCEFCLWLGTCDLGTWDKIFEYSNIWIFMLIHALSCFQPVPNQHEEGYL